MMQAIGRATGAAAVADRGGLARHLARFALTGFVLFAIAVLLLHLAQPDLDPARDAVSYYVHGRHGWLLTLGLAALGAGSIALAHALRCLTGRAATIGRGLLAMWGWCVVAGAIFPADARGQWDRPPSPGGLLHAGAAMLGFLALPVGALLSTRAQRALPPMHAASRLPRLPRLLAVLTMIALAVFVASLWPTLGADRPPLLLGVTERILLAVYVTWLASMAMFVTRQER